MSDQKTLEQLQERKAELLLKREVNTLEQQIEHQELSASLITEGWGDYINEYADSFRGEPDFYGGPQQRRSMPDDRKNGDNAPIFQDENQLALIRGVGELISQTDATAKGALETLTSYVIHTGFEWTVEPKNPDDGTSKQVAEMVQSVVDEFLEQQQWSGHLDRELFKRKCRSGERFVRIHRQADGSTSTEVYEPSWITEPSKQRHIEEFFGLPSPLNWKYGIATTPGRPDIVWGYWAFRDGDPQQGEFIPAEEMNHCKVNVDRNVKRGLSDYYVNEEWIKSASKLLRNALHGGTTQASIALYRVWDGGTKQSQVSSQVDGAVEFQSALPKLGGSGGSRDIPTERWYPGKIIDQKGGKIMPGPMGSSNAPQFIDLVQAGLRKAANSHVMPEFMYTGDASNANYSSTLVSESPFVKHVEALQCTEVCETRAILWQAIAHAAATGRLPLAVGALAQLVDITADPPDVATRDREKEHRIRQQEHQAGILSRKTWASEVSRDYDLERAQIEDEPPIEKSSGFDGLGMRDAAIAGGARTVQTTQEALDLLEAM